MPVFGDPRWATGTNYSAGPFAGQTNKAPPPSGNVTEGFDPQAGLPTEWLNYLYNIIGSWIYAIIGLASGTTFKTIQTDGTGGNAPSASAGDIVSSGNIISGIAVTATTDVNAFGNVNANGNVTAGVNVIAAAEAQAEHFESTSTPAASSAGDTGFVFGTTPVATLSVAGTDMSGVITVTQHSGGTGLVTGTTYVVAHVAFGTTFGTAPRTVQILEQDANTKDLFLRLALGGGSDLRVFFFATTILATGFDLSMIVIPTNSSHTGTSPLPSGVGSPVPSFPVPYNFSYEVGI